MHTQVGSCPRCGAPRYSPSAWWSITPPPSYPSCDCFPPPRIATTTNLVIRTDSTTALAD